ncbi:MAG: condensation domain-containing protein, partial [Enterobacter roggenkampii]
AKSALDDVVTGEETEGREIEAYVVKRIGGILGIPTAQLPRRKKLSSLGYTSIQAQRLKYQIERDYQLELTSAQVNEQQSIIQLTQLLQQRINEAGIVGLKDETGLCCPEVSGNEAERYGVFPLSDIQESYYVGRKLSLNGDRAGSQLYLEISVESLDIYRLNQAWETLIANHDMLRTVALGGERQQTLAETPGYIFKVIDLRIKPPEERQCGFLRVRQTMTDKIFDLTRWPRFEIKVSLIADNRCVIHFSIDTFIVDGSSLNLLFNQWEQGYLDADSVPARPEIGFRDYIIAQKAFEKMPRYQRDMNYWLMRFPSLPSGPQLPVAGGDSHDVPRVRLSERLSAAEWRALLEKAQALNVSGSALILSLFTRLLYRWSGERAFSLILTHFNRPPLHPDIDKIVGPFTSTSLWVTEADSADFESWIQRQQMLLWQDMDHSNVSGIQLLRELKARRKIGSSLLLPVVFTSALSTFNVGGKPYAKSVLNQITYRLTQTPQIYLDHQVGEENGELVFSWDVAESYFGAELIRHLFADYCRILRRLAATPGTWTDSLMEDENVQADAAGIPLLLYGAEAEKFQPFPLTDQQQAYAFGRTRYACGGSDNCLVYAEFEMDNPDLGRLEQGWQRLIRRHDMLACRVSMRGTQHIQADPEAYRIVLTDLSDNPPSVLASRLAEIKNEMMSRVFELDSWPCFEVRLTKTGGNSARLHLCIDMLIADARSIFVIINQLIEEYDNPEAFIDRPGLSFRDYVLSLEGYQKTSGYTDSLHYWQEKFSVIPSGPNLPLSRVVGDQRRYTLKGSVANWPLFETVASKLGVKPGDILLSVYAQTLAAWSDSETFSIAVPCWERLPVHQDINHIVGDFTAMAWLVVNQERNSLPDNIIAHHRTIASDLSHMAVSGLKVLRRKAAVRSLNFPVVFTEMSAGGHQRFTA